MRRLPLALGLACFVTAPVAAASVDEQWTAVSRSAMAVTGDVTLRPGRIVLGRGRSLRVSKIRTFAFTDDIGFTGPATLYRVTKPSDPVLLNGNRLCGGIAAVPVTFIVVWSTKPLGPGGTAGRALAPYSGTSAPVRTTRRSCGIFRYELH